MYMYVSPSIYSVQKNYRWVLKISNNRDEQIDIKYERT